MTSCGKKRAKLSQGKKYSVLFKFFLIGVERNWFYMSTRDEIFLDVIDLTK